MSLRLQLWSRDSTVRVTGWRSVPTFEDACEQHKLRDNELEVPVTRIPSGHWLLVVELHEAPNVLVTNDMLKKALRNGYVEFVDAPLVLTLDENEAVLWQDRDTQLVDETVALAEAAWTHHAWILKVQPEARHLFTPHSPLPLCMLMDVAPPVCVSAHSGKRIYTNCDWETLTTSRVLHLATVPPEALVSSACLAAGEERVAWFAFRDNAGFWSLIPGAVAERPALIGLLHRWFAKWIKAPPVTLPDFKHCK